MIHTLDNSTCHFIIHYECMMADWISGHISKGCRLLCNGIKYVFNYFFNFVSIPHKASQKSIIYNIFCIILKLKGTFGLFCNFVKANSNGPKLLSWPNL